MKLKNREHLTDAVWRCIAWSWRPMPARPFDVASKGLYDPIKDLIGETYARLTTRKPK